MDPAPPQPRPIFIPSATLWLGMASLTPFVLAALAMLLGSPEIAEIGLIAFILYSAACLAFLGGVRAGLEIACAPARPRTSLLCLAFAPALAGAALGAATLTSDRLHGAAPIYAGLFAVQYVWDRNAGAAAPAWYPLLRQVLTGGVMLACVALMAARFVGRI